MRARAVARADRGFAARLTRVQPDMRAQRTRTTFLHSDINVTPLVDVCLVLLIIFMVVLPAMVNDVQLPESAYGTELEKRIFPVTVKNDGTVYIDTLVVRRD